MALAQDIRRGWQIAHPYVRQYLPAAFDIGRRFIGSDLFPLAAGAISNIYEGNSYGKNYVSLFNKDTTYDSSDLSQESSAKRRKTGGAVPPPSNALNSDAIQSPHDPRNQTGTSVDINMVRRMGSRRLRRPRNPGTAYRRIFRSWTGLARLRGRRRGIRPELKSIDGINAVGMLFQQTNQVCAPGAVDGNLVLLNGCSQGTTVNTRIGNRINIKSILVRACLQVPDADVGSVSFSQCVRVMIVKDRQPNGQSFAVGDLFDTTATAGNVTTYAMNLTYRQRFKVLCDRHYVLSGASNAAEFFFEYYSKKNHSVEYNGTATIPSVSEIRTNAIWLCLYGPYVNGGNTTNRPHFAACTFRTRFTDP